MPQGDGKFIPTSAPQEYYGDRGAVLDDYAIRLRAVEGAYSYLNAQFAANTVQLEGLNDGVSRLTDQIGEIHRIISTSIPSLASDVEALKSIEAARVSKRDRRRNFIGRWASGALIAISAGAATKFFPFVWTHWLH